MRIAFVVPWLKVGGVESFVFSLARWLRAQGDEVEIVVSDYEGAWFERAGQLGLPVTSLRSKDAFSEASHARRVGRYLRDGGFDICLLNHARHAQAALAMLPQRVVAVPVIHNDYPEVYEVACGNREAWNVAVAASPGVFDAGKRRVNGKPLELIPYGVEEPPGSVLAERPPSVGPLEALFIGRLVHEQKGVLWLPEILAETRRQGVEVKLTVVGDGPDRTRLLEEAAAWRVLDLLEMKGTLSYDQVWGALGRADVLLMPSQYEGLPLVLLEAMAYGCVPVVSRLGGITDYAVADGVSGVLVEAGQSQAFARALVRLASRRDELGRMSAASRRNFEERFSLERMGSAYRTLFGRAQEGSFALGTKRSELPTLDRRLLSWRDHLPRLLWRCWSWVQRQSHAARQRPGSDRRNRPSDPSVAELPSC